MRFTKKTWLRCFSIILALCMVAAYLLPSGLVSAAADGQKTGDAAEYSYTELDLTADDVLVYANVNKGDWDSIAHAGNSNPGAVVDGDLGTYGEIAQGLFIGWTDAYLPCVSLDVTQNDAPVTIGKVDLYVRENLLSAPVSFVLQAQNADGEWITVQDVSDHLWEDGNHLSMTFDPVEACKVRLVASRWHSKFEDKRYPECGIAGDSEGKFNICELVVFAAEAVKPSRLQYGALPVPEVGYYDGEGNFTENVWSADYDATKLVDGNNWTLCATGHIGYDEWVQNGGDKTAAYIFDMSDDPMTLNGLEIIFDSLEKYYFVDFKIQAVTTEGGDWETVYEVENANLTSRTEVFMFDTVTAYKLRILVDKFIGKNEGKWIIQLTEITPMVVYEGPAVNNIPFADATMGYYDDGDEWVSIKETKDAPELSDGDKTTISYIGHQDNSWVFDEGSFSGMGGNITPAILLTLEEPTLLTEVEVMSDRDGIQYTAKKMLVQIQDQEGNWITVGSYENNDWTGSAIVTFEAVEAYAVRLLALVVNRTATTAAVWQVAEVMLGYAEDADDTGSEFEDIEKDRVVVIAGSDFQNPDNDHDAGAEQVISILNQIQKDYTTADGFLFAGDYDYGMDDPAVGKATLQSAVRDVYGNAMHEVYVQGNHDGDYLVTNGILSPSGANDTKNYGVFVINEQDYMWDNDDEDTIKETAAALGEYLDAKVAEDYTKPIFVVSHLPLHYSMRTYYDGDGQFANYLFEELNAAGAAGLNIIFLFGHNHSSGWDDYLGGSAVYLAKGDSINIAQSSKTSFKEETLNFTYMNAGYVAYCNSSNTGSERDLTMTVFEITSDQVVVKRYSENGLHDLKSKGVTSTQNNETAYDPDTTVYSSPQIISLVEEPADTTALEEAITNAEAVNAEDYTPSTYEALEEALEAAKAVLENAEATQEEVDAAVEALNAAVEALVEVADTSALEEAIENAEGVNAEDYTEESYTALTEALEAAKAVLENAEATQEEVDETVEALNAALEALVEAEEPVDTSALASTIEDAEGVNAEDYTEESYAALTEALEEAKAVLENADATQEEIDAAVEALNAALEALVEAEDPEDPTDPSEPSEPSEPTDPSEPDDGDTSGKTGDDSMIVAVVILMVLSATAACAVVVLNKRTNVR